uniref:Zinc finger protein 385B n=1 Tax=Electrophorus electricus TaxID=8005 RepID=A0A4W4EFH7_ELEEL
FTQSLSPSHTLSRSLLSNTHLEEVAGGPGDACGPRRLLYSLCEVCNIQLNSAAQAQIHYNGKSHLRRVKQLNHAEGSPAGAGVPPPPHALGGSTGSSGHNTSLPSLVRTPPLMMQSSLDMKPFMPFPVDSSTPVGLFANFSTMDPVQKAVINHTFGVSIPPKKKQVISCNICQLRFNSDSQAEAHYKGSKHAKKLKAQETTKPRGGPALDATAQPITAPPNPPPMSVLSNPPLASSGQPVEAAGQAPSLRSAPKPAGRAEPGQESEEEKAKKLLYCSLCKVAVNSLSQLEAHNTGSKHKTMLEARNGAGPIKAYPRPGSKLKMQANILKGSGLQNKTFHCEICDVHVNSEIQLKQHISSRRHKDRVAGKPLKPKYSPYNKQHRGSISLAKLAFQKDLMKPISPSFLSTPFSPTTMPSISLHPRPNASIFQTATLPASFLRAAPGPIRPSTGSILFAPY